MSVQCCFTQALRNEAQAEWTVVYGAVLPPPARNTRPLFLSFELSLLLGMYTGEKGHEHKLKNRKSTKTKQNYNYKQN